jgi:hypothetical protein
MLSGQVDLGNASETVALPGTTDVASFTDTNLADTASSFTATIDWGDGTTTPGTVVGSSGHFTVEGGHTYTDEGSPTATVTVTPTAGGSPLVLLGTVSVADTDSFFNLQGKTITFTPNQPLTNVTVGTFSDSNTSNVASDFTVQIDWGDATTTQGTVTGSAGSFTVQGSHTYTAAGENAISISMADDFPDSATGAISSTAVSGFGGNVTLNAATEGTALTGVEVATFADTSAGNPSTDYTAQINWGDGVTTAGTVSGANGGPFTVTGSHTYADEEGDEVGGVSPLMQVTVTRTTDNATIAPFGTVLVADADVLAMTKKTLGSSVNQPLTNVTVATFTDTYTGNVASDLAATIDWGDGSNIDTGTVSGSNGAFTVTGSHTYAADGQFNVNVSILDDIPTQGQIGFVTSTAVIGLLPGTGATLNGTENTAVPAGTQVATFIDGNTSDAASAFSASVNWGDGTTTPGTVSGSNGSFTVTGGPHSYADEGQDTLTTTVTRTADQDMVTVTGSVTVGEGDSFAVTTDNFSGDPGTAINNVQVATFTDTFAGQVASDLTGTINWGDGSSSAGTVSGGGGAFTVDGSHTYATGGNYTFNVSVADDAPGTATASANGTATINFAGQVVLTSATEGTALPNNTPVATFSDSNGGDTAGSFTATINWGDGTTTPGTVVGGAGSFTVEGGHTYADEGSDTASVTLTHTADQSTSTVSGAVSVAEADVLTPHGTTIAANAHQVFSGAVATFTDSSTANVASDFTASIDWGDGTTTTGTVSGSNGSFTVSGSHTYTAGGQDTLTVTLSDDAPGTAAATTTTTATVRSLAGQMALNAATEGTALANSTPVATFSDTNTSDTAGGFTGTINWGDGTTTTGTVVGGAGSFTVEGGHTYADEGGDPASVTLTHTADQLQATASGNVAVAEADVLTPHGTTIAANAHQVFSGTVATFSDSNTANVASDFTAAVDWGDGTTTAGTVSGSSGSFTVSGSHTYSAGGQDTLTVTLSDDAPGTAAATTTSTATVRSLAGQMALNAATEGTALANSTPVATFSDNVTSDTAGGFTATINWGDGTTTTGTVVGGAGSFTVEGGHTYADEGGDPASVTLTHTADQLQATASGNVAVAEGDVLTAHGTSIAANAHQVFSGTVATFTDGNTANVASDFTAAVDWGDGTTTAGTVSGGGGSFTVNGAHTYTAAGNDTVKVTLTDDAPGTATATATTAATVSRGSAVAYDFNGDGKSDLLFQNTNATPQIWLMNGTSVVSMTTLPQPPSAWKIVTAADFNGDGNADILWINTNTNQPAIWEMNGTSIVSAVGLTAPPPSWHIAGAGDLFGSGDAAIIWQNSDGTPSVWQMNGTSLVSAVTLPNPGPAWKIVATGDFNGDGKTDLLWDNTVTGQPSIWEMNGDSIVSAVGLTPQPANMQIVGTGDFNGDGDADVLWINTATNAPTIWLMNGTSVSSMTTLAAPPPSWRLVGTSDINGDGKADLLWQNSDGTVTAWEMNGTSIAAAVAVGNPGVPWILNNNDPPLPGTTGATNGGNGTMRMSMPDAASGNSAGAAALGGLPGGFSTLPLIGPLASGSPFSLAGNGTTVANSLHIGSG